MERNTHRVGHHLKRRGLPVRDAESVYLQSDDGDTRTGLPLETAVTWKRG